MLLRLATSRCDAEGLVALSGANGTKCQMLCAVAISIWAACAPPVAYIDMEPPVATLTARGASVAFKAIARDGSGQAVKGARTTFTSLDPDIVSVDASGVATALKSGDAKVWATFDKVAAQVSIRVSIASSISVSPAELVLDVGKSQAPAVRILDELGWEVPNPIQWRNPDDRGWVVPVQWENSNPEVAKVWDGSITALAPGTATMTAKVASFAAAVKVTVRGPAVRLAAPKSLGGQGRTECRARRPCRGRRRQQGALGTLYMDGKRRYRAPGFQRRGPRRCRGHNPGACERAGLFSGDGGSQRQQVGRATDQLDQGSGDRDPEQPAPPGFMMRPFRR